MTIEELLRPQPDPKPGWASVTDWLTAHLVTTGQHETALLVRARRRQGIDRYGVELTCSNGRNPRVDLLQELVDALLYAAQDAMEAESARRMQALGVVADLTAMVRRLHADLAAESSVGARQGGGRPELATRGSAPSLSASPTGLGGRR